MGGEKSKNFPLAVKRFAHYLSLHRFSIALAGVFGLVGAVFNLVGPNKISEITDLINAGLLQTLTGAGVGSVDLLRISRIGILLVALYLLGFLLNYGQGFLMATVAQRVSYRMRQSISAKINRLPLRYFDSHTTGDTLSRITNDVDMVGQSMNMSFSSLVSSLCLLIGSALMMFYTNWLMALSGILAAVIGFLLVIFIVRISQRYFDLNQQQLGKVNGIIEETYGGHLVVNAYNAQKQVKDYFGKNNDLLFGYAWKSQFLAGLMLPLMMFIGNLAYVIVCVLGAVLVIRGDITFGTIVAFMLYIRLFTQPLQSIAQALSSVQSLAAASERVFEFLDEGELADESKKTQKLTHIQGEVEFSHVRFGYEGDRTIIHDFSLRVNPGQKVAIVGPTGAGKTTIVNLLMRFYEIDSGSIRIDGVDISEITRENLHQLIGMVLQDTWIFEGSLRENLTLGNPSISDQQLDEVCESCNLTHLVQQLPQGYDSLLQDSLSAGERQLITIARAMLEDAPLLILDEATSNVDSLTERKVQSAMDSLTKARTSFVIAHRLSTIQNADQILVLQDGDIVEVGTHQQLLEQNGAYAHLYHAPA